MLQESGIVITPTPIQHQLSPHITGNYRNCTFPYDRARMTEQKKTAGKEDKMKGLTKKVAAVLLVATMIIPAGASVLAKATQDADAEAQIQSVTITVQNTG